MSLTSEEAPETPAGSEDPGHGVRRQVGHGCESAPRTFECAIHDPLLVSSSNHVAKAAVLASQGFGTTATSSFVAEGRSDGSRPRPTRPVD